jgi:hypothetical protein
MFDDGIVHLIEGSDTDRPRNAPTLTHDLHQLFGNFEIFFEPTAQPPHTCRIDSTESGIMRNPISPLFRTLYLTTTRSIDPPSPRLLAPQTFFVSLATLFSFVAESLRLASSASHAECRLLCRSLCLPYLLPTSSGWSPSYSRFLPGGSKCGMPEFPTAPTREVTESESWFQKPPKCELPCQFAQKCVWNWQAIWAGREILAESSMRCELFWCTSTDESN